MQELYDGIVPDWHDDIDFTLFRDTMGLFAEAAFLSRRHRSVLLADTAFAAYDKQAMPIPPLEVVAKWVGIYDQLGAPLAALLAASSRPAVREFARSVLNWDFDSIWCSHLGPVVRDGRLEFERAFAFAFENEQPSRTTGANGTASAVEDPAVGAGAKRSSR